MHFTNGAYRKTCPPKAPPAPPTLTAHSQPPTPGQREPPARLPTTQNVFASSGTLCGWNHVVRVLLLGDTLVRFFHGAVCGCKLHFHEGLEFHYMDVLQLIY